MRGGGGSKSHGHNNSAQIVKSLLEDTVGECEFLNLGIKLEPLQIQRFSFGWREEGREFSFGWREEGREFSFG